MPKPARAMAKDEVPITQWEAERKKEVGVAAVTTVDRAVAAPGGLEGWEKEGRGRWAELEVCWAERWV